MGAKRMAAAAIAALGVLAGAGWWYAGVRADTAEPPETAEVRLGDLEITVAALGKVEPKEFVDVGAQISGQVLRLHVGPGDRVAEGDLLAEIDPTVFRAQVAADRAALAGLEAQLVERRAMQTLAEQQRARQQGLFRANATSRESLDIAAAEAEAARARVAVLEAEIGRARSTLATNEANLSYTRISAPMDGTVMSLAVRQGQTISARQAAPTILQIADLETVTVKAQVSEADVGRLAEGMEAWFTTLGEPGRRWTGRLRQVLPTPEVVNDVVLYQALFDVDNADRRLMPQMTAQVFFVVGRAQRVPLVPVAALAPVPGERDRFAARVLRGGAVEGRTVTVGLRDRVRAQVLDGLAPGERVVVERQAPRRERS
jgi:macrolide-specific efflux system membrane fusion protein